MQLVWKLCFDFFMGFVIDIIEAIDRLILAVPLLRDGHFELLVDARSLVDFACHVFDDFILVCNVDSLNFGF